MRNLLVEIAYNGANYHGFQVQKNAHTIAHELQDTIEVLIKVREPIVGCSRTDTGVHANSFYFNMKTKSNVPTNIFMDIMNNALPQDIVVLSCKEVDMEFHSRYSSCAKEYVYKILNTPYHQPFLSNLVLHWKEDIDVDTVNDMAQALVGKHNFESFCSSGYKEGLDLTRTVEYIKVERQEDFVLFYIKADGFLYNMVRIIVGTLLDISCNKLKNITIEQILEGHNRTLAGRTAPPQGLYLNRVFYD